MKAFKLRFDVAGERGLTETVLISDDKDLETALEEKTAGEFNTKSSYSKITSKEEIPLSAVKIGDLSITEFLSLKN
jgi:hypothetical protein